MEKQVYNFMQSGQVNSEQLILQSILKVFKEIIYYIFGNNC